MDTLEELKKQRAELDKKIEELERKGKPIERFQKYYLLTTFGGVTKQVYDDVNLHINNVGQGNAFHTEQEAELEAKRRNLLHRIKIFRDKCNDGWEADFKIFDRKYLIVFGGGSENLFITCKDEYDYFNLFGYFKNEFDAKRAIELFGDEIKRLYVESDGE